MRGNHGPCLGIDTPQLRFAIEARPLQKITVGFIDEALREGLRVVGDVLEDDVICGALAVGEAPVLLLLLGWGGSLQGGASCGGSSEGQDKRGGCNDKEE